MFPFKRIWLAIYAFENWHFPWESISLNLCDNKRAIYISYFLPWWECEFNAFVWFHPLNCTKQGRAEISLAEFRGIPKTGWGERCTFFLVFLPFWCWLTCIILDPNVCFELLSQGDKMTTVIHDRVLDFPSTSTLGFRFNPHIFKIDHA